MTPVNEGPKCEACEIEGHAHIAWVTLIVVAQHHALLSAKDAEMARLREVLNLADSTFGDLAEAIGFYARKRPDLKLDKITETALTETGGKP